MLDIASDKSYVVELSYIAEPVGIRSQGPQEVLHSIDVSICKPPMERTISPYVS